MNDLQKELGELKQFIGDLKADRAEVKAKEKREAWTKYVSLTVVIIAVLAAITSQWAGKYSSGTQINQALASDQWAYYQAKSIKQHLFEVSRTQISKSANPTDPEVMRSQKDFEDKVAKYEKEKAEIKAKAEEYEKRRDTSRVLGGKLGLAVTLFSVAIATASICMVTCWSFCTFLTTDSWTLRLTCMLLTANCPRQFATPWA